MNMSCIKKSNSLTMEEVHKKYFDTIRFTQMTSILMSHMIATKIHQNVHIKYFWPIVMTIICDIKIDINVCEHHYINWFIFVNLLHSPAVWHLSNFVQFRQCLLIWYPFVRVHVDCQMLTWTSCTFSPPFHCQWQIGIENCHACSQWTSLISLSIFDTFWQNVRLMSRLPFLQIFFSLFKMLWGIWKQCVFESTIYI